MKAQFAFLGMMERLDRLKKPRVGLLIFCGVAVALAGLGLWAMREPPTPFAFLNQFPVAERRSSADGTLRIVVLHGDLNSVWNQIRAEFKGKRMFTSSGLTSVNGLITEYRSLGTDQGMIKVSNDLSFANEGYGGTFQEPDLKPGYCAVAYTRPKTVLDEAVEWVRRVFSPRTPITPPPQSGPIISV